MFLLVTGASGAGKSTVRRAAARELSPEVECVELYDIVGVPASGHIGMSVSIFSYRGEVTVGLMTDAALVPHPAEIVTRLEEELRTLAALDTSHRGGRSRRRRAQASHR